MGTDERPCMWSCQKISFSLAILSRQHPQFIPRHLLSDETPECVIATLRYIIPCGPCSPQRRFSVGCFQMGHEAAPSSAPIATALQKYGGQQHRGSTSQRCEEKKRPNPACRSHAGLLTHSHSCSPESTAKTQWLHFKPSLPPPK